METQQKIRCPRCHKDAYEDSKIDFEYRGIILPNTPCLRCSHCGDILFTAENYQYIWDKIRAVSPPLELRRRISQAGRRPALYLPEDAIKSLNLKIGSEVRIYVEDKRRLVIEPVTES